MNNSRFIGERINYEDEKTLNENFILDNRMRLKQKLVAYTHFKEYIKTRAKETTCCFQYTFYCFHEIGWFIYYLPLDAFEDFLVALYYDVRFICYKCNYSLPAVFVLADGKRSDR